jgi:hypothetical protein
VEHEDIQALLDGLAGELGAAVVLEDTHQRLLAHTDHGDLIDDVRRASILDRRATATVAAWFEQWGIRETEEPVRTPADEGIGALERWCVPVRFRGTHLGYIWILDGGRIGREELPPAVDAADQISPVLYRRTVTAQADAGVLRLLLVPGQDGAALATEIRQWGAFAFRGPVVVIVAEPAGGGELSPAAIADLGHATRQAAEHGPSALTLGAVISDLAVLLLPLPSADDMQTARRITDNLCRLAAQVGGGLNLVAAIGSVTDLEHADRSYRDGRRALRILRALPELGPVAAWDDLGIFRALALLPPEETEASVLDPRVRKLLADHELSSTAEIFLDLAGSIQQTAARLHVHRGTLYQRLARIKAVHELDLHANGEHRLITHLGLKFARLGHL